jgi:sugar phosphate permease
MLGFFQGFYSPCAVSLIVDYFPSFSRGTAMSILACGPPLGSAINSLTTIAI